MPVLWAAAPAVPAARPRAEPRNLWQDPAARQFLNDRIGSETVPIVVVGEQVLVNPSATEVAAALEAFR